ncbi:38234_t:CDS:2, partial [Gigaspora margarita]
TYIFNDSSLLSTTTSMKVISKIVFDEHLDGQNINLCNSSNNKCSNNKSTSLNFVNIISQVQKGTSSAKTAYTEQTLSSNNLVSTSQNRSQHIFSHATHVENEENAAFISNNDLAKLVQVRIQEAMPKTKDKRVKNL